MIILTASKWSPDSPHSRWFYTYKFSGDTSGNTIETKDQSIENWYSLFKMEKKHTKFIEKKL